MYDRATAGPDTDIGGGSLAHRKGLISIMKKIAEFAFKTTIPVLCGYLFLGMAFGLLLRQAGYGVLWALFSSVFVYAGAAQFVLTGFLGTGIGLVPVALMTLSINIRHAFYGLSFVERFKKTGRAYPYMIFSLTDETYSLLCSVKVPGELDEGKALFAISLFDQLYWILGSVAGTLLGGILTVSAKGVDFSMTALFLVIFVEQILSLKSKLPAVAGAVCGFACLLLFGADRFILPSLVFAVSVLLLCKNLLIPKSGEGE